jgi:hypothetical protein
MSSGEGIIVTTLSQVIFASVNNNGTSNDAVFAGQAHQAIFNIKDSLSVISNGDVSCVISKS